MCTDTSNGFLGREPSLPSFPRKRESSNTMSKQPAVYILASMRNGTLYIGVTSDLPKRVREHSNNLLEGFTKRYGVHRLVYYELHEDMAAAIRRETQVKKWEQAWKLDSRFRGNDARLGMEPIKDRRPPLRPRASGSYGSRNDRQVSQKCVMSQKS